MLVCTRITAQQHQRSKVLPDASRDGTKPIGHENLNTRRQCASHVQGQSFVVQATHELCVRTRC